MRAFSRGRLIGFAGILFSCFWEYPQAAQAMPTFAQAYGMKCSVCHTMVPLLNAYGRYVQRSGYALLDRDVLSRAVPVWVGESVNYDSTAGAGTGVPRYAMGNLALHGAGYLAPDVTFHVQQWLLTDNEPGTLDTLWVAYTNLLHHAAQMFIGKIENPAPSPYSQTMDIDGPSASGTVVGEHDWSATYGNRWGAKVAYERKAFAAEAGYLSSSGDLDGAASFSSGDKTFQWKTAYAPSNHPLEAGFFGSIGSVPVSSGTDIYHSIAAYVQLDPSKHGMPGALVIYQATHDANPGMSAVSETLMPATDARGASMEFFESLFRGGAVVSVRHDFNDNGFGTLSNGNAVNLAFNVPGARYLHGYLESAMGGNSTLAGASGGPMWKGMLWWTFPVAGLHN